MNEAKKKRAPATSKWPHFLRTTQSSAQHTSMCYTHTHTPTLWDCRNVFSATCRQKKQRTIKKWQQKLRIVKTAPKKEHRNRKVNQMKFANGKDGKEWPQKSHLSLEFDFFLFEQRCEHWPGPLTMIQLKCSANSKIMEIKITILR